MIEHKCAWCGCGDGLRKTVCGKRYICTKGVGCQGIDTPYWAVRTRDESGENGPETWVDVGQMPEAIHWPGKFAERCGAKDGALIMVSAEFASAISEQLIRLCANGRTTGYIHNGKGYQLGIDPDATQHVRVEGEADAAPSDEERNCMICGEAISGPPSTATQELFSGYACNPCVETWKEKTGRNGIFWYMNQWLQSHGWGSPNQVLSTDLVRAYRATMGEPQGGPSPSTLEPEPAPDLHQSVYTHTAEFEFSDGRRVSTPEPGEGWEKGETVEYPAWPATYVLSADYESGEIERSAGFYPKGTDVVTHEQGLCWLKDMGPSELEPGVARVVSVTRWTRGELQPIYIGISTPLVYEHCASLNSPAPEWPESGRPQRVIQGGGR